MSTFFRVAVYLSFVMIGFNLSIAFVGTLGAFPVEDIPGTGTVDESSTLTAFTRLTGGMEGVWLMVTSITGIGAIILAIAVKSFIPVGVHLFSVVFWTAYIKSNSILSVGGYIPGDFLAIFFVCMIFLFIAAVIGMLIGSG